MNKSSAHKGVPAGPAANVGAFFATRGPLRAAFLDRHLAGANTPILMGEDWGTRRYYRVTRGDDRYILMEAVPAHLPFATLGHRIADFITVAKGLRSAGLHTPHIDAVDADEGYVLMEDMGDIRLWDAIASGAPEGPLYECAVDVLGQMDAAFDANTLGLPTYNDSYIHAARRRLVDWYIPALHRATNPDGMVEAYLAAWEAIEKTLPPPPMGVVHGDYHLQNLMWLPGQTGVARCGLLDFQDAMWGPLPYDLANLLDDIRRDVPPDIRTAMVERRLAGMDADQRDAFMAWYPVLALEFHCRIVGQVIRLALVQGKMAHLKNLPRVQAHVARGLALPVMAPLQKFMHENDVRFDTALEIDPAELKKFIRSDAF